MARFTLLALAAFALAPALTSATAVADATAAPAQHSKAGRKAKHFGVATTSGLYNHYSHPKTTDVPDAVIKVAYQSYSAPAQAAVTSDAAPADRPVSRRPYHHHYHNHHGQQTTSHAAQTTMSPGSSASARASSASQASEPLIVTTQSQSVAVPITTSSPSTTATSSASSSDPSPTSTSSPAASSSTASTSSSVVSTTVATSGQATTATTTSTTTTTTQTTSTTTLAVTTTSSSASASATPSSGGAGSLQQLSLDAHNTLRAAHNAAPLTWNTDLAAAAQKWADKCVFQHGGGTALNAGENISGYSASSADDSNVPYAISLWSNEASLYDWNNPGYSDATGHFTQMVWKGTTELGCAQTYCTPLHDASNSFSWNGFFYVCEYLTAGNIVGQTANQTAQYFSANVQQ